MTLSAYIWGMRALTFLAFLALGGVIFYIDPEKSGMPGLLFFYLLLFLSLGSFFNLVLVFIRRKLLGKELATQNIGLSFRQGMLLALIAVSAAVLQSQRALVWWAVLLAAAGVFLIELYFLSRN